MRFTSKNIASRNKRKSLNDSRFLMQLDQIIRNIFSNNGRKMINVVWMFLFNTVVGANGSFL